MTRALILLVEDDPDGRRSIADALQDAGHEVISAANAGQAMELFRECAFDTVVSDICMPGADGFQLLAWLRESSPHVPVILITAFGSVDAAVAALKAGAYDYILKPLNLDDLQAKVARAIENRHLRKEVARLSASLQGQSTGGILIAESSCMKRLIDQTRRVAPTDATVLLLGESGTGKELVAHLLHAEGRRASGPFVAVNCGAFSETLLESELFGHEKGAFTGALGRHEGAFERADDGTLFLDEIGLAPLSVQMRLLRAIEQREVMRVGGREAVQVNVRVISATNRDLEILASQGRFLPDLLYRLKVVTLKIPPLRERRQDIRRLAEHFLAWAAATHGRRITTVEPAFFEKLEKQDWPGNVRELRHAVESSVILAASEELRASDLAFSGNLKPAARKPDDPLASGMTLAALEKFAITQALERLGGNVTAAAKELGVSAKTVARKIKEYNLPF